MDACVCHRHMGLLHGVAQLTANFFERRFNLFKALDAVDQQSPQCHRDGGFLQCIAKRMQIAGQASTLPSHLLAEFEFFAQHGQLFAHHVDNFAAAQPVAFFLRGQQFFGSHGIHRQRRRWDGGDCCDFVCRGDMGWLHCRLFGHLGFQLGRWHKSIGGRGFGRFALAFLATYGVVQHLAKASR